MKIFFLLVAMMVCGAKHATPQTAEPPAGMVGLQEMLPEEDR